ncbi:MAG: DUF488 domain-containing protein [Planctomycetia bacterium]|nr:DUF488 domain-containing protein [Planctomycetia bacterium]
MSAQLYTIGHSTHPIERFLALLTEHGIEVLADIRRFPGSRKYPQFNQENLPDALAQAGIEYRWFEVLGGRRRKPIGGPSENVGLRNESFRNYADYMETAEFQAGAQQLLSIAERKPTAYMCAEGLFWQCHRRLVSDYFSMLGETVQNIMPAGDLRPHVLTTGARVRNGRLRYLAPGPDEPRLLF